MTQPDPLAQERAYWDDFAALFEERMEPNTVLLARALLAHLRLPDATGLLEVGAGAGGAALAAREHLAAGARHVVTDLSPEMLRRARAKLPDAVEVREADAGALPCAAGEFDRYLANMNLMLVPDPDRALAEAARALAPGGLAAWSVWGRPELSTLFTIPPRAAEAAGVALPPVERSNFHLGEREALRARVAAAGFEDVLAWYHPMALPARDPAAYAQSILTTPRWRGLLADATPAQEDAMRAELERLAGEELAAGRPIAVDALVAVARRAGA